MLSGFFPSFFRSSSVCADAAVVAVAAATKARMVATVAKRFMDVPRKMMCGSRLARRKLRQRSAEISALRAAVETPVRKAGPHAARPSADQPNVDADGEASPGAVRRQHRYMLALGKRQAGAIPQRETAV